MRQIKILPKLIRKPNANRQSSLLSKPSEIPRRRVPRTVNQPLLRHVEPEAKGTAGIPGDDKHPMPTQ